MGMKRPRVVVGALLSLLSMVGLGVTTIRTYSNHDPLYSVAAVHRGLAQDPAAWANRTLLVRGVAMAPGCVLRESTLCVAGSSQLAYMVDPTAFALLPLTRGAANSLLSFLRRLPLPRYLAPLPQTPHWGTLATYRVQLHAAPADACTSTPCYEALLLDAAPNSP